MFPNPISYDAVDIGKIFLSSSHTYELILSNKGQIDAIFSFLEPSTAAGKQFSFQPKEGIVMPGGYQLVEFSFSALILGKFEEKFYFQIDGTAKKVEFTVQGEVIGPTFQLHPASFNLGLVSLGFPIEKYLVISHRVKQLIIW